MKYGSVALFGRPNAGKSTLLNAILGEHIAITSATAQTTRNQIQGIYNDEDSQIVFLDTPGIHKPVHKLGEKLNREAYNALNSVDVVCYLVDASDSYGPGNDFILERLEHVGVPVILLLNKVDKIKKPELAELIMQWKDKREWAEIFPISGLKGHNVKQLLDCLKGYLDEGEPFYDKDMITNQSERFMVSEYVREKILRLTEKEVPHSVAVAIDQMKFGRGKCDIIASIIVEKESQKSIIIGRGGALIKRIGTYAREDIEKLLGVKVNLELFVRVEKDWRNKPSRLKEFGYKDESNL